MKILFENFATLADAPNGVPKLREMILQLAVQGKLVPQDPMDEPAIELLKKIKAEKEKRIASGELKMEKQLPPIREDEKPFDLPEGWEWVRLGNIAIVKGGKRVPKGFQLLTSKTEHVYIRVTDMKHGTIIDSDLRFISEEIFKLIKNYTISKDDLYLTIAGTIGQVGEVPEKFDGMNLTENAAKLSFWSINKKYFRFAISSTTIHDQLLYKVNQMAQPKLALKRIQSTLVPLPPLAEQSRIVAKVDQLMALCDELEKQQEQRAKKRINLHKAVIHQLLESRTPVAFTTNWQRIEPHFELLYSVPENVTELKQAILQLAVQGKLVPQNPNDEPASVLLEKIKTEKEKRIAAGEIKKEKPLPPIGEDEKPFDLPEGWGWTKLHEIGTINPRNYIEDDLEVSFSPMALVPFEFEKSLSFEIRQWKEIKSGFTHFKENDVLVAKITPSFENGKSVVAKNLKNGYGAGTTELHVFRGVPFLILPEYVIIYFKSPNFLEVGALSMTGTAGQQRVPKTYIAQNPFPLPPLAEQTRIVTKVNTLLQMCDELATQLTQSRQQAERLMNAVVQAVS